jgi:hypothetical protein
LSCGASSVEILPIGSEAEVEVAEAPTSAVVVAWR